MIELNELRLGNWFFNPGGNPEQVSSIQDGFINTYDAKEVNPIPLTPEILGKLPLEGASSDGTYGESVYLPLQRGSLLCFTKLRKEKLNYEVPDVLIYELDTPNDSYAIETATKHFHHLQNLYFALMGTELEIKL